jgi:hypothetical protein
MQVNLKKDVYEMGQTAMLKRESWSEFVERLIKENADLKSELESMKGAWDIAGFMTDGSSPADAQGAYQMRLGDTQDERRKNFLNGVDRNGNPL